MRNLTKALCGVLLLTGSLFATENEIQRIPVGDREMSSAERLAHQETRLKQMEENQDAEKPAERLAKAATYISTHVGAYQYPYQVAWDGSTVELTDRSIWSVSSDDRWSTLDWLTGDTIIIVPNTNPFSIYSYRLINLNTGANVKVNLALGPIYNGIYTKWIVAIDTYYGEIMLQDGSFWKMSSWDSLITNNWYINDTVIIGINNGWLSGSNPNILININRTNYAIGYCVY